MRTRAKFFCHKFPFFLLAVVILISAACQPTAQDQDQNEDTMQVTVSILPQAYFVKRIAGNAVKVNVMVKPGEEAHTYEPKPEQMKFLNESQIFFSIGVEYEASWIPRFEDINPNMEILNSAAGIQRIEVTESHTPEEEPDQDDDNHQDGLDPHVWLAPHNGKIIAGNILEALIQWLPTQTETFQNNYDALIADIDELDAQIEAALTGFEQRKFMVFHPAWGYFADQYNLEQIPVQVGGQDPSPRELAELVKIAEQENIQVIFVQPTFSAANAEAIAQEINAEVAVVDPLARDWLANLKKVADAFATALRD